MNPRPGGSRAEHDLVEQGSGAARRTVVTGEGAVRLHICSERFRHPPAPGASVSRAEAGPDR